MSRESLDVHLRRYYGSQEIDPGVLGRLKQLADLRQGGAGSLDSSVWRTARRSRRSRVAVMAAAAALVLLSLVLPGLWRSESGGSEALATSILREIALNHSKNLAVEFAAIGYPQLRERMAELDFPLRAPRLDGVAGSALRMLGGRYCSIQGRLAAQIKLEDERGHVLTLYQTSLGEQFDGLPELQRELDGIQIRVWREDDLLFALARSI